MKRILFLILFLLSSSPAFATDWCADANCQGCWLFSEGTGTSVADDSQNSNSLSFKGAGEPAWDATDIPGAFAKGSALFDGSNDYASVTSNDFLISTSFTVIAYVKVSGTSDIQGVVSRWADTHLRIYDNNIQTGVNHSGWDETSVAFTATVWSHAAQVFDSSAQTLLAYADGTPGSSKGTDNAVDIDENTLWIGDISSSVDWPLGGNITEIAIFDSALDSTDINDIMDNGLKPAAAGRTRRFF